MLAVAQVQWVGNKKNIALYTCLSVETHFNTLRLRTVYVDFVDAASHALFCVMKFFV